MTPSVFVSNVNDGNFPYPLWGLVLAVVVGGLIVVGLRWRTLPSGIGDAGIILFNFYFGLEWGGVE